MKKHLTYLTILILPVLGLLGCGGSYENNTGLDSSQDSTSTTQTYFDCSIKFSKTLEGNDGDYYFKKELPINKDIFVMVDFTFYNLDSVDDVIDFKVNLKPGFDTYSVHDYTRGPQEPTEPDHEEKFYDDDGVKKVIEISGMKFNIKSENAKKHYYYVFTIQARKTSNECEFKTIFSPQDGLFNDGRNKSFSEQFTLVDYSSTEEGEQHE